MATAIDITGVRFGYLVAVQSVGKNSSGNYMWETTCDCGNTRVISSSYLRNGQSNSCGCMNPKYHGHFSGNKPTPTYTSWQAMKNRCLNRNYSSFKYWGGRGITVCRRWLDSFENFLEDMGERPEGRSLDRIDNDGNYEPSNCRWATSKEQANNRRPRANE